MNNIFIHDAVPTWSGFIYQGEIAIYLVVKKICELRDKELKTKEEIGSNYQMEVEQCEDIAILYENIDKKEYISIHQVKNQKDTAIGKYRSPLVQLMLEKGFYKVNNLGNPKSYLHVSNKINIDEINKELDKWKINILKYYKRIKIFITEIDNTYMDNIFEDVRSNIENEPIKFNRSEYRNLIDSIKQNCKDKDVKILKKSLEDLIEFLEREIAVPYMESSVSLYKYEDNENYSSGGNIFSKIVEQVERYKNNDNSVTVHQYNYIADKLINHMRKHILSRHDAIQKGTSCERQIPFSDFQEILDNSISDYEEEANILALRRLYDERLARYCVYNCKLKCKESEECKLQRDEFRRGSLEDNDFKKLCYSFNPDCSKSITNRECLNDLLNKDGLKESVFEVLNKVPEKYFIQINDNTKFIIDNENNNAFLTAISENDSEDVVRAIVEGIENNTKMVSHIFEADQIITSRLDDDDSAWDNDYTDIQKYLQNQSDSSLNSICNPKKPEFIEAKKIVTKLSNIMVKE